MRLTAFLPACQLGALRADSAPGAASQWFTGVDSDTSTVLSDFPFREYSPIQGRWLSPEPAGLAAGNAAGGPGGDRGGAPLPRQDLADADPQIGMDIFHCPGCPALWHNTQSAADAAWYVTLGIGSLGIGSEPAGAWEGASSVAQWAPATLKTVQFWVAATAPVATLAARSFVQGWFAEYAPTWVNAAGALAQRIEACPPWDALEGGCG
ncbi:MAG: hypothetical protein ACRD13_09925 [Terriglobales bacterium]